MRTSPGKEKEIKTAPGFDDVVPISLDDGRTGYTAPLVPLVPRTDKDAPKWLVCHDYKNGQQLELERDYSFQWWHLIDTFISFSHDRVTAPPASLVRCAHRHGVAILGTLIFEWDQAKCDLISMIKEMEDRGGGTKDKSGMTSLLTECAERRGFEGWLINVEVEARDREQVRVLLLWLEILTKKIKHVIPHGQVLWYDGLNFNNELQWQNKLTSLNQPFLNKCDGIFLNYFWKPDAPNETAQAMDKLKRPKSDAYFGIDVWGRGQYGGGGFDCWVSLDVVNARAAASVSSTGMSRTGSTSSSDSLGSSLGKSNSRQGLSTALFAPAWTVESEDLNHTLNTEAGFAKWLKDEMYLWAGGPPTDNVAKERLRRDEERRKIRELHYVIHLAVALGAPSTNWPNMHVAPFDYKAPLPPLPGVFKPMCSYRKPRAPESANNCFVTNFGIGSGHAFAFDHVLHGRTELGWTDPDLCFPAPSLAYANRVEGVAVELSDAHPWMGAQALELTVNQLTLALKGAITVPICPVRLSIETGVEYCARIVWRECTPVSKPAHTLSFVLTADGGSAELVVSTECTTAVYYEDALVNSDALWFETTAMVSLREPHAAATIDSIGVRIGADSRRGDCGKERTIVLGSIQLCPRSRTYAYGQPRKVKNEHVRLIVNNDTGRWLRWLTVVRDKLEGEGPTDLLWTSIWHLPPTKRPLGEVPKAEWELLGITTATEFELSPSTKIEEGTSILLQALREDGSLELWGEETTGFICKQREA